MNKKGFTLIELLAVIVILAVIMLIGVTAVLPLISKAQKNSLASEGLALIDTGKVAYQAEQFGNAEIGLSPTDSYCFSLDWLRTKNYYDKASNKYSGSVLILYNSSGKYDYYFWITNGNYHISGGTADSYTVEDGPGDDSIYKCGGFEIDSGPREIECNIMEGYGFIPVPTGYKASDCSCAYNGIGSVTVESVYGICKKANGDKTDVAIITPYHIGTTTITDDFNTCEIYMKDSHNNYYPYEPGETCIKNHSYSLELGEKECWEYAYFEGYYNESNYYMYCYNDTYSFEMSSWLDWPKRNFQCNGNTYDEAACEYWMERVNTGRDDY